MKSQILSSFFIPALLLVLLHSPLNFAQTSEAVSLPYQQPLIELTPGNSRYYKLDISQKPEGVDVSISVLSNKATAPKLYVSKNENNQTPQSANTADYVSTSYNGNIVFIPGTELVGVQNLYVGLGCSISKCEGSLSFEYSKEFNVEADGTRVIESAVTLRGASSAVIRLTVPQNDNAERIVIHVDAIPNDDNQVNPELDVFLNIGNDIPYSNHAENIPRTSWFEGRTIVIYKNTDLFCTGCNYTLSLKFDPYSSISFEADVFEADTTLGGTAILDGVRNERSNTYTFQLEEARKDEELVIDIKPQEGTLFLKINCDKKPANINAYYWTYNVSKPMDIILTPRERKNCPNGTFYLLATSREPAVYSIRLTTKTDNKLFVGKDDPIIGDIFSGETIEYEIFMPLFAAEEIVIELGSRNHINISIINCRFPTDCPGLLPAGIEFRHQIQNDTAGTYEPPEFTYSVDVVQDSQILTINPHESGCYPIIIQDSQFMQDPLPVCAYKVTLFSDNVYPVEYSLKAESKGHQWLFIGISKLASVVHNETAYFVLNVPHKDAAKVNIQLTKFSGDVDIFVSKTEKFPNQTSDETQFSHEGMIIFQNQTELNGTYYIGVHGIETSSFGLSATVLTDNNKTEDYAQTLTLGVPQKGVLLPKHEHPARFYKFTLDLDDDWEGSVNIAVNTLRGSILIAVNNNDRVPLPNFHMWNSTNQEISISNEDEYFDAQGTYYIGVFVDWSVAQPAFDDITFNIVYYLREATAWTDKEGGEVAPSNQINIQHLFLSPLTPFHRTIKKTEADYYEAFILPKDIGITLYKQADAGDVDLFVSLDPDLEYPDENHFTYSTKTTHKDYLELSEEDLNKTCEAAGTKLCTFYLAVIPKGDTEKVSYSLSMKRDYARVTEGPSLTPLEDGRQLQLNLPNDGQPVYFYFYTLPYHPSVITVSCPGEEISIYANKNRTEIGLSTKPNISPPTENTYDFTTNTTETSTLGLAHLTIPAQNTLESSVVSLAVIFKHPIRATPRDNSTVFNILVSSQMTRIYTGKPYHGAVEAGSYVYYSLNVFKPSCTLLISLTTLNDGDPDLVVSNSLENLPTLSSHQFASISTQRTELLEINELDIYPKKSMEGTWVFGVYGRTKSTFTFTVLDEDQKMVQLKADTPFEMYLREDSRMYFKYYHGQNDDIEIRMDLLSGSAVGHVTWLAAGEDEGNLVETLTAGATYKWDIIPKVDSVLAIPSDDGKACEKCLYVMMVEAFSSSKLSITVTEGRRFIKLQNGVTYTNQLKPLNSKTYLFSSSNAQEVTLSVNLKGAGLKIFASQNREISERDHIWEATLTSSHPNKILSLVKSELEENSAHNTVHNGIEYVKSEKDSFYIQFENPGAQDDVSYTFTVTSKDSSPILRPGSKHMLQLEAGEATSLIYYSSRSDEVIKLNIEFTVDRETEPRLDQEFDRNLRKGIPVVANFWGEKTTAGLGKEIPVEKDHVVKNSIKSEGSVFRYALREGFTVESRIGKYSFDIENPFDSPVTIWATVYSTEFGTLSLDQNAQHSTVLREGMSETYEVFLATSGAWYLWAFSCVGNLTFSVGDTPNELENGQGETIKKLKQGQDHLYQYRIEDPTQKYARFEAQQGDGQDLFVLSSKFFFEPRHYNYGVRETPKRIQAIGSYQPLNSQITVSIEPLKIDDYEPTDEIVYHVKTCPWKPNNPGASQNLCNIPEDCKLRQASFKINDQQSMSFSFDRLPAGMHYVHVTADIMHNGEFIKFIPYPIEELNISKPIVENPSNALLIVAIVLIAILVLGFVCYKCYGRLQRFSEEKGFELPTIGKRGGYGFLGDDL